MRSITALPLILLAACGGTSVQISQERSSALTYAHFQSLAKGLKARTVIQAFGKPEDVLWRERTVRGLTYLCENTNGDVVTLRMVFDESARLTEWRLSDPGTGDFADWRRPIKEREREAEEAETEPPEG